MSESPECFVVATPVAVKPHRCCECRGFILPGEKYERASGIWNGDPMRFKTCSDCAALRKEYNAGVKDWEELAPFEALGEVCHETRDPRFQEKFEGIKRNRLTPTGLMVISLHERNEDLQHPSGPDRQG